MTDALPRPDALVEPPFAVPVPVRTSHLAYVDGLRAFLALFVVAHHIYLTLWPFENEVGTYGVPPRALRFLLFGHLAVDAFITVSGFCLMLPVYAAGGVLRGGTPRFFWKRARRILPPYFAAIGLSLLLIYVAVGQKTGTHWDVSLPVTARDVLAHTLLLSQFLPGGESKINHAFWSICVEWWIYFLFPLLVIANRRLGPISSTVAVVLGSMLVYAATHATQFVQMSPHYVGLFAVGMLAASACRHAPTAAAFRRLPLGPPAAAVFAVVLAWHWHYGAGARAQAAVDLAIGLVTAYVLASGYASPRPLHALLSWPPLVALGTMSYSLYLIHAPLVQLAWQWSVRPFGLSGGAAMAVLLPTATALSVGVGVVFFWCFERPCMSTRQRKAAAAEQRVLAETSAVAV